MSAERAANRANFPRAAEVLDEFRAVFGKGCQLRWASENGREIGKRATGHAVSAAEMVIETAAEISARKNRVMDSRKKGRKAK